MGMFDTVIPECELPDAGARDVTRWQTKDFDVPYMEKYRITAEGRLLHERVHYEDRSDPTAVPGSLASILGMMTPVHEGWDDLNYHGVLNFYGSTGAEEWYEYNATFTHGQLESVQRVAATEDTP